MTGFNSIRTLPQRRKHSDEVFYVIVQTAHGKAVWLRWTIHLREDREWCSLWIFKYEEFEPNFAARFDFDLTELSFSGESVQIRGSVLNDAGTTGNIREKGAAISWKFTFSGAESQLQHFSESLYYFGIAKSCLNSRQFGRQADGWIEIDGVRSEFRGARVVQSHIWGRGPTANYAWVHCSQWDDGAVRRFEALTTRPTPFGIPLPAGGPFVFRDEGLSFEISSLVPMFSIRARHEFGNYTIEAKEHDTLITAEATAVPESTICVEYAGVDDSSSVFCHNSLVANLTLRVFKVRGAMWRLEHEHVATQMAALEVARPFPDPSVVANLKQSENFYGIGKG